MTSTPPQHRSATAPASKIVGWSARLAREFRPRDLAASIPAALLAWFLTVIFSVSIAALIFRGPLAPWLSLGIGMSLLTAVIVGVVTTLRSSLPGVIAIPSDRTAPMLGILASTLATEFGTSGDPATRIGTCIAALILSTFLSGATLVLLGHYRLGQLMRFLPFPVVGGFMAGAGWLLVKGALTVVTGFELTTANLSLLAQPVMVLHWGPSVALATILAVASRKLRHFAVIPAVVALAVVVFYVFAAVRGITFSYMRSIGWLLEPFTRPVGWPPVSLKLLGHAQWFHVFQQGWTISTVLLVGATSMLMICSALELAANVEIDVDRELETAGIANLAAAVGGGLVGFHSLSVSTLMLRSGPRSRWVGLLAALGTAATLLIHPGIVVYLPVPVLGGLLFYLGLNFLTEWLITTSRRMPRSEYLIIVIILVAVAWWGYVVGVGVGLVLAVVLFTLRYSRIDVVRLELSGNQHRSHVDRTPHEKEILRDVGPSILILKLQGFIFFGTAHSILHRVRLRAHNDDKPPLRDVFMDFRHVTGIDSSTILSFSKLLQMARQLSFNVVCTNVPPRVMRAFRQDRSFIGLDEISVEPDIDHAMERCEVAVLAQAAQAEIHPNILELLRGTMSQQPDSAERLLSYFVREEAKVDSNLAVQGDRTRDLFLIERGRISAHFRTGRGSSIRLRTMGAGAIVGEIGLYLGLPRTASIIVDSPTVLWRLSPESLRLMEQVDPLCAASLHRFLAETISSRLVHANELLENTLY